MSVGVVLFAFGKRGYHFAAYNLAMSIKHFSPGVKIALFYHGDGFNQLPHHGFFDQVTELPFNAVHKNGVLDPAKVKTSIYDFLPYDENLYLDVDACALKPIEPLLDHLKKQRGFYLTDVVGQGVKGETINYAIWSDHNTIWKFFNLKPDSVYPAIQSSYAYIRKSKTAEKFFAKVKYFYEKGFPLNKLAMRWGGTVPDELLFSGTCAKMNIMPTGNISPIFFGWKLDKRGFTGIEAAYYFTAIYGNGQGKTLTKRRYLEWYDKIMENISKVVGSPRFKHHYIMNDKHANN